eukprot:TRINITY_DN17112_c2_g1_i1.p1 TRINITY_DN17112_c2_g1~~TRINITY_DN17112_c2_g1_i1.p1  ORF type:complete len:472 (+),score=36.91 TRINITY_DN17112_c2_g1_i1:68-1483(+)
MASDAGQFLTAPTLAPVYVLDARRWFVLCGFCIFSCNQCLTWFTFSSVNEVSMGRYFGHQMDKATIDLLLNWGPIGGIIAFPLQTWITAKPGGLRYGIWLGILFNFSANVFRTIPLMFAELSGDRSYAQSEIAFVLYHIGQFLNAVSGPLCMGTCTLLSVVWFGEKERTIATAFAQTANGFGTSLGFLNPLWLATDVDQIPNMFYFGSVLSVLPLFAAFVYLPARPPHFPSAAAAAAAASVIAGNHRSEQRELTTTSLKGRTSFVVLLVAAGSLTGVLNGWQGLLQSILDPAGFSDKAVGWMGFVNSLAAIAAAVLCGNAMDRCCQRRLKMGIIVGLVSLLVSLIVFMLSLPCFLFQAPLLATSRASLVFTCALCGVCQGITNPLFYELAAELLYPQKEGTSAGILVAVLNVTSMVMIQLNSVLSPDSMTFVAVVVVGVAVILVAVGVREEYKRPRNSCGLSEDVGIHSTR